MRILFLALLFIPCSPPKSMNQQIPALDLQGHRGCRGLMPENTIPAMIHALDLGVNTLEMDVVISQDRKVVVSHEPFFNHEISIKPDGNLVSEAEEQSLNIYQMQYSMIQTFDVGSRPHPRFPRQVKMKAVKPLLQDLIDSAEKHAEGISRALPWYNIEIKSLPGSDSRYHPAPEEFTKLVMDQVMAKGIEKRTTIQSFDLRPLRYLHEKFPEIRAVLLVEEGEKKSFEEWIKELGFKPAGYSPHYEQVTEELVSACRREKIRLVPWTVNNLEEMKRLVKLGVDGIISDYPDLFSSLRN
jgi:glycerophosphoryl diester phosphodiesterase